MKKKVSKPETARMSTYWICDECAKRRKWSFPVWPVTVTDGLCGHCTRTDVTMLTPIVDFGKNGNAAIWD